MTYAAIEYEFSLIAIEAASGRALLLRERLVAAVVLPDGEEVNATTAWLPGGTPGDGELMAPVSLLGLGSIETGASAAEKGITAVTELIIEVQS